MTLMFSICHIGWTEKDFKRMWERLAKENPYTPYPKKTKTQGNRQILAERGGGVIFDLPEDFQVYGWKLADIRKVQRWLMSQNCTVDRLDDCKLDWKGWCRERIYDSIHEDFK